MALLDDYNKIVKKNAFGEANAKAESQALADELPACGTLIQLQAIKASYGDVAVKGAWKLLPKGERENHLRIK